MDSKRQRRAAPRQLLRRNAHENYFAIFKSGTPLESLGSVSQRHGKSPHRDAYGFRVTVWETARME